MMSQLQVNESVTAAALDLSTIRTIASEYNIVEIFINDEIKVVSYRGVEEHYRVDIFYGTGTVAFFTDNNTFQGQTSLFLRRVTYDEIKIILAQSQYSATLHENNGGFQSLSGESMSRIHKRLSRPPPTELTALQVYIYIQHTYMNTL